MTDSSSPALSPLDACAERYVKLVLALGQHDSNYVDAYYGPKAWAEEAKASPLSLEELATRASALVTELEAVPVSSDEMLALRRSYLLRQTDSLATRARLLRGEKLSFDEESQALYNARAPVHTTEHFEQVQAELERLLPGPGPLMDRIERFRQEFIIPKEKLDVVFRTALDEARRRTLAHIPLPAGEGISLEYVTNKTWSGYNWYQGSAKSLIQINTDLPIFISRAIDLAAHEGYPGHHVYNVLLEQHLLRERGWVEFSVYALFSPQSLIAEGSANYGIDVAFPDAPKYLREVLFPLAGLDPKRADLYVSVEKLAHKLNYAENEAVRGYLDGRLTREQARDWLARYRLMSLERATKFMANADAVRAYVINYNLGRDMVADFIERQGGTDEAPDKRWQLFQELLSSPRLPGDLR
ncbi:hypothetical protein [Hyalangium versicolor]|uniref:hypothetical protein n=1 Tax=Hyalangium versicolor TaxID=2861190 RepID=UPI001CC94D7A|nr:hypothetical protein [Hyalangium versicolor]